MSVTIVSSGNWRDSARKELEEKFAAEMNLAETFADQARVADIARNEALNRARQLLIAARALGIPLDDGGGIKPDTPDDEKDAGRVTARDIILAELAENPGMKAAELKLAIEKRLGRPIHYKTPGMTLYRLASEGLVRREGHRWYALTGDQRGELDQRQKELLE